MSARDQRDNEREAIRAGMEAASLGCWEHLPIGEEPAGHAVDQLAAIGLAICNLAETIDARGDEIPSAIYGIIRDQMS